VRCEVRGVRCEVWCVIVLLARSRSGNQTPSSRTPHAQYMLYFHFDTSTPVHRLSSAATLLRPAAAAAAAAAARTHPASSYPCKDGRTADEALYQQRRLACCRVLLTLGPSASLPLQALQKYLWQLVQSFFVRNVTDLRQLQQRMRQQDNNFTRIVHSIIMQQVARGTSRENPLMQLVT
jgi:hypothetical protein